MNTMFPSIFHKIGCLKNPDFLTCEIQYLFFPNLVDWYSVISVWEFILGIIISTKYIVVRFHCYRSKLSIVKKVA